MAAEKPLLPVTAGVGLTALWTAYCRAEESKRDHPLVVDPFAERMCGAEGMRIGGAFESEGRAHDAIVVRTRMIDERIEAAFGRGVRSVLSLGCGLCARPYRLNGPPGTRFVEVDLSEPLAWKEQHLVGVAVPEGVSVERHVANLAQVDELSIPLSSVAREPLLVVLEGVLQYLEPAAVRALFIRLARRNARTTIVCDVGGGAWSRMFARRIPQLVARRASPYVTRIDDPRAFFEPLGFELTSDVSLVDWDARTAAPRWRTPWSAWLVPGFRRTARVIELHEAGRVARTDS